MHFFKLKHSDQIYFYIESWCSAGGIYIFSSIENVKCCKMYLQVTSFLSSVKFFFTILSKYLKKNFSHFLAPGSKDLMKSGSNPDPDPKHWYIYNIRCYKKLNLKISAFKMTPQDQNYPPLLHPICPFGRYFFYHI